MNCSVQTTTEGQNVVPNKKFLDMQGLHERAVTAIHAGKYEIAISSLFTAIRRVTPVAKQQSNSSPKRTTRSRVFSLDNCLLYSHLRNSSSPIMSSSPRRAAPGAPSLGRRMGKLPTEGTQENYDDDDITSTNADDGFVYCDPIHIPSYFFEENAEEMKLLLPTVLTFNMALAYHLRLLRDGRLDHSHWSRAQAMYEHAYRSTSCSVAAPSLFFRLMISNNLSQVHHRLAQSAKRDKYLYECLGLLMSIMDNPNAPYSESAQTMVPHWDDFVRNVTRVILADICAAAA